MKIFKFAQKIVTHRYLSLAFRLYIAGIFIYAAMYKISYAGEFAETIASYRIIPYWSVNITAVVMPWLELICGLLLISGIRAKAAVSVIIGLLAVFTIAIVVNLIRDTPIGCGCFKSLDEKMDWTTLVRDLIWLSMAIHIYFFDTLFHLEKKSIMRIKDV
ncbi:MauE/DoxX family redox-associated membrane protein [Desulfobacterales bacterium HSG16]|nr:MauE/DoxX family redox-associated membrane protein [Desulfobacterales bacterium HSG16]